MFKHILIHGVFGFHPAVFNRIKADYQDLQLNFIERYHTVKTEAEPAQNFFYFWLRSVFYSLERLTGHQLKEAYVDRGYRGVRVNETLIHFT